MLTRRTFLHATGGLGAALLGVTRINAADGPIAAVQNLIDRYCRRALNQHRANAGVVVGIITPETAADGGALLFAGGDALTNPAGAPLPLDENTPFAIGSIAKVFTSGMHYMLHGPYEGTLGSRIGGAVKLSGAVGDITLKNLAIYQPGFAQDNRGGAYPPGMMANLNSLFARLARFTPPYEQGACYAYSNLGWSLLAMAAVGLEGDDTAAFTRRYDQALAKFCASFGATRTLLFRPDLKPRLPMGYRKDWAALPRRNPYQPTRPPGAGSGGIVSTGADMLRFLRYNMGLMPGGATDPALAYQQTETFHARPCSGEGRAPVTSYGWFHAPHQTPRGGVVVVNKNGGVAGFTSWMGFARWQGAPSTHGVFTLSNSPGATMLGTAAMRLLLRG